VTIDGYWIDNWIYWITISYTTRLQCITLYNLKQLSLFSCSEDPGSNCCNQLLWHPLPSLVIITNSLTNCSATYPANRPQRKHLLRFLYCCIGCPLLRVYPLPNNGCQQAFPLLTVDLGPLLSNGRKQACMSHYILPLGQETKLHTQIK
jgi:hypothetical protein